MIIYVVEAKTKWSGNKFTGGSDEVEDLASYFKDWADKHEFTAKNIWYADVFKVNDGGHGVRIGSLELTESGNVLMDIDMNGKRIDHKERFLRRFGICKTTNY